MVNLVLIVSTLKSAIVRSIYTILSTTPYGYIKLGAESGNSRGPVKPDHRNHIKTLGWGGSCNSIFCHKSALLSFPQIWPLLNVLVRKCCIIFPHSRKLSCHSISIRRQVSNALLSDLPALLELGLMLWGSRCIVPLISCFNANM